MQTQHRASKATTHCKQRRGTIQFPLQTYEVFENIRDKVYNCIPQLLPQTKHKGRSVAHLSDFGALRFCRAGDDSGYGQFDIAADDEVVCFHHQGELVQVAEHRQLDTDRCVLHLVHHELGQHLELSLGWEEHPVI